MVDAGGLKRDGCLRPNAAKTTSDDDAVVGEVPTQAALGRHPLPRAVQCCRPSSWRLANRRLAPHMMKRVRQDSF
jgi:hypothetical protein